MARRRAPHRWICPLCGRSVPPDVPTCYCGTSRAAVEAQARRDRQRKASALQPLALLAGLGVIAGVLYLALARNDAPRPPKPSAPEPSSVDSTPEAQPIATRPPSTSEQPAIGVAMVPPTSLAQAREREWLPTPIPVPVPTVTPSPTPSPKPERTEVDIERDAGERRLEQTLAKLAAEMTRLSTNAREFESVCLSSRGDPSSCERLFSDISSSEEALGRGLDKAEEDARRSWVSPGVVRDLRRRYGLEESTWRDLANTVHHLTAQYRGGS